MRAFGAAHSPERLRLVNSLRASIPRLALLALAFAAAVAFAVAMQSWFPGNTLGGGISFEQAKAEADDYMPYTDARFVSARVGRMRDFEFPGFERP